MSRDRNYRDPEGRDSGLAMLIALLINLIAVAMVAGSIICSDGRC
ncbi:hypothetical protein [Stenotrophomonas sp. PS02298]|nr:hypothetical protein [Stenotrophomonas sp. PS02298]